MLLVQIDVEGAAMVVVVCTVTYAVIVDEDDADVCVAEEIVAEEADVGGPELRLSRLMPRLEKN